MPDTKKLYAHIRNRRTRRVHLAVLQNRQYEVACNDRVIDPSDSRWEPTEASRPTCLHCVDFKARRGL